MTQSLDPRARRAAVVAMWLVACVVCYAGWQLYWFLCDDAFIAFRYVSNRQFGYGYVWNAPPFLPVEGYSSFSWLLLLDAIWSWFGIDPPHAANNVSLVCALLSLSLVVLWQEFLARNAPRPLWMTAWALLLIATHRSFLVWASSGLETALFDVLLLAWVMSAWRLADARFSSAPLLAATAVLLSVTRPDGLLFAGVTFWLLFAMRALGTLSRRVFVPCALLLLGTPLHLAWRNAFYGTWLPNPYYAKVVGAWPEAGLRFLAAFALEYGLWLSLPLICMALLRARTVGGVAQPLHARLARGVALGTVSAHVLYYVLVVGGDHFEYRVLTQLVPLLALAGVWAVAQLTQRAAIANALCALLLLAQSAIPWTHWRATHTLNARSQTLKLVMPVAPELPAALWPITVPFDALQAWLIPRGVAVRHQEHKVLALYLLGMFPRRESMLEFTPRQINPVVTYECVGVAAWALPRIAVLDVLGLNDYVIARTPLPHGPRAYMAHERKAPPGYLSSFLPDIDFAKNAGNGFHLVEVNRPRPLTDDDIRGIEGRYRAIVDDLR